MNKVILSGALVRDVELKQSQSGMSFGKFTLAVNRKKDKNGEQKADFFNCTAFGKTSEIINQYCKKGSKLLVEGEININSYKDKEGNNRYSTDVMVHTVEFIGGGSGASKQSQPQQQAQAPQTNDGFMNIPSGLEDELPFE